MLQLHPWPSFGLDITFCALFFPHFLAAPPLSSPTLLLMIELVKCGRNSAFIIHISSA
jgi:hypothetical protein